MRNSRRNKSNYRRRNKTSKAILGSVNSGLTTVANTAKSIGQKSKPMIERGLSGIYGTLATGFNMGMKGVNMGMKGVNKGIKTVTFKKQTRRHRKTRRH